MAKSWKQTEKECLRILSNHKLWCHLFVNDIGGQPCDIVAIGKDFSLLIDVKHCNTTNFELRRIETNQWNCFEYAKELGINSGFAIYCEELQKWKWLGFKYTIALTKLGKKKVAVEDLQDFDEWLGENYA